MIKSKNSGTSQAQPDESPIARSIDQTLTPYLTHPQRRDREERVILMDRTVQVWRLESFLRGDIDSKLCAAARSLLLGRLISNRGINAFFAEIPYVDTVELVFYRVKTSVSPSLSGAYEQTRSAMVSARMSITRERAGSLNLKRSRASLRGADCISKARELFENVWVSDEVVSRREQLREAAAEVRAYRPNQMTRP